LAGRRKLPGGHVVRDANGQALAYLYGRDSEAETMQARGHLEKPDVCQSRWPTPLGTTFPSIPFALV
jgi:hypothetical protein